MSKENFYTLLSRYRSGNCTDQEKRLVEQWFATLDEEVPQRTSQENNALEERIWNAIQHQTEVEKPVFQMMIWKWAAAAVIILALGWVGYQYKASQNTLLKDSAISGMINKNLTKETNNTTLPKDIKLPDGSQIELSPNSSIAYEPSFSGVQREVYLDGRAFFQVKRDTERPFFVHTGDVVTKVLGTSFWVNGSEDKSAVEVSVLTGKVSVSQHVQANQAETSRVKDGVILTANQRVKYTVQTRSFETGLVSNPVPVVAEKKGKLVAESFDFQENPFSDVIAKLEETYGIEIILEDETFTGCLFSGNITKQPLFTKLDLLCNSVNASYEVRGTRILISGKGCPPAN